MFALYGAGELNGGLSWGIDVWGLKAENNVGLRQNDDYRRPKVGALFWPCCLGGNLRFTGRNPSDLHGSCALPSVSSVLLPEAPGWICRAAFLHLIHVSLATPLAGVLQSSDRRHCGSAGQRTFTSHTFPLQLLLQAPINRLTGDTVDLQGSVSSPVLFRKLLLLQATFNPLTGDTANLQGSVVAAAAAPTTKAAAQHQPNMSVPMVPKRGCCPACFHEHRCVLPWAQVRASTGTGVGRKGTLSAAQHASMSTGACFHRHRCGKEGYPVCCPVCFHEHRCGKEGYSVCCTAHFCEHRCGKERKGSLSAAQHTSVSTGVGRKGTLSAAQLASMSTGVGRKGSLPAAQHASMSTACLSKHKPGEGRRVICLPKKAALPPCTRVGRIFLAQKFLWPPHTSTGGRTEEDRSISPQLHRTVTAAGWSCWLLAGAAGWYAALWQGAEAQAAAADQTDLEVSDRGAGKRNKIIK
eukprot:1157363-Pelagomonas_calceolata.AAC.3